MYNNGSATGYYCTLGFDVRGSNGWLYTVTAGHCLTETGANESYHNGIPVGYEVAGQTHGSYPYDGTIMPFIVSNQNYATYWNPSPWVIDLPSNNYTYALRGTYTYNQIGIGWVACSTGANNGTSCGQVTGKDGGIIMNTCVLGGDSGGPLYSEVDQMAYGITHGSSNASQCSSGSWADYSSLQSIFSYIHMYEPIVFTLKTS